MGSTGKGAAWASVVAGVASVATIPVAVYVSRFIQSFRLQEAGYAIPLAVLLGALAILLARRSRLQAALRLGRAPVGQGAARAGRLLGIAGLCIAASGLVALAVYGLLQYAGSSG